MTNRPGRRGLIFLLFTGAYFLSYFYRSANAVIAPDLAAEMGLDAGRLGLMTSLFFATFAAVQIPLGLALDRWGARWVTPGLMLVAVAGSLIFAAAPGFAVLALGRALIGAGMAGVLMGSLKIFSQWYPAGRFATVSGLLVGLGSLGALVAATPLAWLNRTLGWRLAFVLVGSVTAVVALAVMAGARNHPPGQTPARGPAGSSGRLSGILLDRRMWRIAPLVFFSAGTLLSFQGLWAGPYLFDVLELTDLQAGNALLVLGAGATLGYTASGWLSDRFGLSRVILLAAGALGLSQLMLAFRPPPVLVFVLYGLLGFSGGFNVMLLAHARRLFPLHMTGQAVTVTNLFGIGGTFLLQWWVGLIVAQFARDADGRYPPAAYTAALIFMATGTLVTLGWYWPLARRSTAGQE